MAEIHRSLDKGVHTFLVMDTTDCTAEIDVSLDKNCSYYVPNIFTHNDGVNENNFKVFFSKGAEPTIRTFSVYDKWGELVFNLSNTNEITWDGKFGNTDVIQGVYTYLIDGHFKSGEPIVAQGTITVIR